MMSLSNISCGKLNCICRLEGYIYSFMYVYFQMHYLYTLTDQQSSEVEFSAEPNTLNSHHMLHELEKVLKILVATGLYEMHHP